MSKGKTGRTMTGRKKADRVSAKGKAGKTVTDQTGSEETAGKKEMPGQGQDTELFEERLRKHHDELRWLYMELYENDSMFAELCDHMYQFYLERNDALKALDADREKDKEWYKQNDMLGMMFYIDNFAGNMKGVQSRLD